MAAGRVFADDTVLPVLDPGSGREPVTRPSVLGLVYLPGTTRPGAERSAGRSLSAYRPGSSGTNVGPRIWRPSTVSCRSTAIRYRAACRTARHRSWLPAGRTCATASFNDVHQATGSPIAQEVLRRIAALYAISRRRSGAVPGPPAERPRGARAPRPKFAETGLAGPGSSPQLPRLP